MEEGVKAVGIERNRSVDGLEEVDGEDAGGFKGALGGEGKGPG